MLLCSTPALGSPGTLWILAVCCSATSMKGQLLGMASGPHQAGRCMHQACPLAHRLAQAATGHLFQPWLPNVPPSSHRHPQPPPGSTYGISSGTTVSWRAWGASFSIAALQGGGGNTGSGHTPGPANPTFITCPSPPPPRQVPAPFGAHPLSRRTVRARGALVPHLPCGSRLTPVARSTLQEQARPDKSVGFGAKPHVPAGPGASSALGPKVEWGLHTNLLSRAAGDPLPAGLSIFPRLPLHKDTTRQGEQGHISTSRWVLVPC